MRTIKLLFFLFISFSSFSQNYELKGIVRDSKTNERLGGVHIQFISTDQNVRYSLISNLNGDFSIKEFKQGEYQIQTSCIAYKNYYTTQIIDSEINLEILIEQQMISIGEVVVSSLKSDKKIRGVPVPLELVDKNQIELASSFTASDVLQQEPGVALARDGVWATGINIRGLGQQRIVMLVDGNRIETATDLMASMSFFDVGDIEQIEVIKGASSALYGTGAMGGIVNIITRDAYFNSSPYFNSSFNSGYSTVNEFFTSKLTFNSGSEKWFAYASVSMRNASNMNTPEGKIENSQFEDKSISLSAGYKIKENQTLKFKYQYFDADDAGIPGGDAFPGTATATYSDAKRQLISVNYEIKNISDHLKLLNFRYFHQSIVRDVEMIPNISTVTSSSITTPELITPEGTHITDGIQIQANWSFYTNNDLIIGLDAWRRELTTSREKYIRIDLLDSFGDITATNHLVRGETPIPNSCFGTAGLFFQDEQKYLDDRLKILIGGRLDGIRIANEQALDYDYLIVNDIRNDTPPNQRITFDKNEEYKISWSANLGLLYSLTRDLDLSLNAGRAFRAPSLEESFKYIDLGNMVRLGDPNLEPEDGYSLDVGLRLWKPKFQFKVNGFVNWISNMIVEENGYFIYSYTSGIVDTIPALINTNVDKARLYGIDLSFQYNLYKNLVLHGVGSFVKGNDVLNNSDLPLIPPMNGRLGLRYNFPKYLGFDIVAIGFADQDKVADGESQTKGYARFDFLIHSTLINLNFAKLQFFGGVENIGDRAYTNHLATNRGAISIEPGRNLYLKMKVLF